MTKIVKRIIAYLLIIAVMVTAINLTAFVEIEARAETDGVVNTDKYYEFDFSADKLYLDYENPNTESVGYEFDAFQLQSTGKHEISAAEFGGKDALRIRSMDNNTRIPTIIPLKEDGSPVVLEAGKQYKIEYEMYVTRIANNNNYMCFAPYVKATGDSAKWSSATFGEYAAKDTDGNFLKYENNTLNYGDNALYVGSTLMSNGKSLKRSDFGGESFEAYTKSGSTFTLKDDIYYQSVNNDGYELSGTKTVNLATDDVLKNTYGVTKNEDGSYMYNDVIYTNLLGIELPTSYARWIQGTSEWEGTDIAKGGDGKSYYKSYIEFFITKLVIYETSESSGYGYLKLYDDYSNTVNYIAAPLGEEFVLPDISNRALNENAKFVGWYADEERTQPIASLTATNEIQSLYSAWSGVEVSVTFIDEVNNTRKTLTGKSGEAFEYPADPVPPTDKCFDGWFTSTDYTTEYTLGTFGNADMTLYAGFSDFDAFKRVIDYSSYTVNNRKNCWSMETDSEPYHTIVDDSNASGGKYLNFHCTSGASAWLGSYTLTLTSSGTYNITGSGNNNVKFPNNTTYKVTVSIRVNKLSGREGTFFVSYGKTFNSALNGDGNQYKVLKNGIKESEDFVKYELFFTTPAEYVDTKTGCFIGFTAGGGVEFDYDIDDITIEKVVNVDTYAIQNGEQTLLNSSYYIPGEYVNLPVSFSEEVYSSENNTATIDTTNVENWYGDSTLKNSINYSVRAGNKNSKYYAKAVTTTDEMVENQIGFCGFDLYEEDILGNGIIIDDNFEITDEDSFTGKNSLKANCDGLFEIRNKDYFAINNHTTYHISFAYKADKVSTVSFGISEISDTENSIINQVCNLEATDEWRTLEIAVTADISKLNSLKSGVTFVGKINTDGVVYIDTIKVSSVVGVVGTAKLKETIEQQYNIQALRFMMAYKADENSDKISLSGKKYNVTERGVLISVPSIAAQKDIVVENIGSGVFVSKKTSNFDECWSYNSKTGNLIFSTFITGFEVEDTRELVVRGYVKLSDGNIYYSDLVTASVSAITENSPLINDDADIVSGKIKHTSVTDSTVVEASGYESTGDYYIYLPEGTEIKGDEFAVYQYDVFFKLKSEISPDYVSEYTMQKGAYVRITAKGNIKDLIIYVPCDVAFLVEKGTREYLSTDAEILKMSDNLKIVSNGSVNYIFVTDLHHSKNASNRDYMIRQMNTVVKLANENDAIDFVMVGGDITTGMFATKELAIESTQDILNPLKECNKPVLIAFGNHDDNSYHVASGDKVYYPERIISDLDWNKNVIEEYCPDAIVKDNEYEDSKYYYYDIPEKKTRVIVLDAVDCRNPYDENGVITELNPHQPESSINSRHYKTGYSYWGYDIEQIKWLGEEAMTAEDDWNYIYMSHMGIDGATNASGHNMFESEYLRKLIAAFQYKNVYNYDNIGTFDFTATTGKITVMNFGHTHAELTLYDEDIDLWQISTACANISQYSGDGNVTRPSEQIALSGSLNVKSYAWKWYYRALGSSSENCFDVVSADENRVIKYGFGTGSDSVMYY